MIIFEIYVIISALFNITKINRQDKKFWMKTQNFIETGSLLLLRENITLERNCSKPIKGFFF